MGSEIVMAILGMLCFALCLIITVAILRWALGVLIIIKRLGEISKKLDDVCACLKKITGE